jgi:hypothetical protein
LNIEGKLLKNFGILGLNFAIRGFKTRVLSPRIAKFKGKIAKLSLRIADLKTKIAKLSLRIANL